MSYTTIVCEHCGGEVKVYADRDGILGDCPTCGAHHDRPAMVPRSRIPDEGAFYEVLVNEFVRTEIVRDDGSAYIGEKMVRLMDSLAIYPDLDAALKRAKEARDTEDGIMVYAYIKKWNHARTDYEWLYQVVA